jgi:hypothetical protein
MASKKSKSEQKFEQSLHELRNGIPVAPPKRKSSFRNKITSFFAGMALTVGGAHLIMDDDSTDTTQVDKDAKSPITFTVNATNPLSQMFNTQVETKREWNTPTQTPDTRMETKREWNTPTQPYGHDNFNYLNDEQNWIQEYDNLGDIWLVPDNIPSKDKNRSNYNNNPWAGPNFGP